MSCDISKVIEEIDKALALKAVKKSPTEVANLNAMKSKAVMLMAIKKSGNKDTTIKLQAPVKKKPIGKITTPVKGSFKGTDVEEKLRELGETLKDSLSKKTTKMPVVGIGEALNWGGRLTKTYTDVEVDPKQHTTYDYSGKKHTLKNKVPKQLKDLQKEVEEMTGKGEGYYNHILVNVIDKSKDMGKHKDNEELYWEPGSTEDNPIVGDVAVVSIGGTTSEHTINGVGYTVEDMSVIEFNGNEYHSVGAAGKDGRISITFRHIPDNKLATSNSIEDKYSVSDNITELEPNQVFVFGSNLAGRHGKGAAETAKQLFGATTGNGTGIQGQSYAIPTKDGKNGANLNNADQVLSEKAIQGHITEFLEYAKANPNKEFLVTAIGTGLAGIPAETMHTMFEGSPDNVKLPKAWEEFSINKDYKLNITAKPDKLKAEYKLNLANKYIGFGVGSTASYATQLKEQGMPVNSGKYTSEDVVFVSINGHGKLTPKSLEATIDEVVKALEAGATVLSDSNEYLESKGKGIGEGYTGYNIGETMLREELLNRGYINTTDKNSPNSEVSSWKKVVPVEPEGSQEGKVSKNFKGYEGGFTATSTIKEGDGKDKAMREVADGFIGEIIKDTGSTNTSWKNYTGQDRGSGMMNVAGSSWVFSGSSNGTIMLARNGDLKGEELGGTTKNSILTGHENGATFVVGDTPGVDSQFIDYLNEIDATYTIYHTGDKSRIVQDISNSTSGKKLEDRINNLEKGSIIEQDGKEYFVIDSDSVAGNNKVMVAETGIKHSPLYLTLTEDFKEKYNLDSIDVTKSAIDYRVNVYYDITTDTVYGGGGATITTFDSKRLKTFLLGEGRNIVEERLNYLATNATNYEEFRDTPDVRAFLEVNKALPGKTVQTLFNLLNRGEKRVTSAQSKIQNVLTLLQTNGASAEMYLDELYTLKEEETSGVLGSDRVTENVEIEDSADFQHSSDRPKISTDKKVFETILRELQRLYPAIKVEAVRDIYDQYGSEVIGKAIRDVVYYDPDKASLDTLPHEYAHIYINLLENTTFVKNTINMLVKEHKVSREEAKEILATKMGQYALERFTKTGELDSKYGKLSPKHRGIIGKIWDKVIEIMHTITKMFRGQLLAEVNEARAKAMTDRMFDGVNASSITLEPKKGTKLVDPDKDFSSQPFAMGIVDAVMTEAKGNAIFTGSEALAMQGDVYRAQGDNGTDLHDLDFAVYDIDTINKVANKLEKDYSTYVYQEFDVPANTELVDKMESLVEKVPQLLVLTPLAKKALKYANKKHILTLALLPKGNRIADIKRFSGPKSRIVGYNVRDNKGSIVGTYTAKVTQKKNSLRTEILSEEMTGVKAVLVDLLEDNSERSTVKWNAPSGVDYVISSAKDIFRAKNALSTYIPRDKDVRDFNSFYKGYNETNRLGSDSSTGFDKKDFEDIGKTVYSNPTESLKLLDMLDEVEANNGANAKEDTAEHKDHLRKVLKIFTDSTATELGKFNLLLNKEGEKTAGEIDLNENTISVKVSRRDSVSSNDKSVGEVFVHEVTHAAIEYALSSGLSTPIRNRLERLYTQARKVVTVEDFYPETFLFNEEAEKAEAQKTYDYIFNSKEGLREFTAHGLTNDRLIKALNTKVRTYEKRDKPTTMLAQLQYYFKQLMDFVTQKLRREDKDMMGDKLLMKLSKDLALAQYRAIGTGKKGTMENAMYKAGDGIERLNDYLSKNIKNMEEKISTFNGKINIKIPAKSDKALKATWIVLKQFGKLMLTKQGRNLIAFTLGAVIPGLRPEGTIQMMLRAMGDPDALERTVEMLVLAQNAKDNGKKTYEQAMKRLINEGFEKELTDKQKTALNNVLIQADVPTMSKGLDVKRMLDDEEYLDSKIEEYKTEMKDLYNKRQYNYLRHQAHGLGHYISTGNNKLKSQKFSSFAIMQNIQRNDTKATAAEHQRIDDLASMYALKYTAKDAKKIVSKIWDDENTKGADEINGIDNLLNIAHYPILRKIDLINEAGNSVVDEFRKADYFEQFDENVTYKIDKITNRDKMHKEGYKLIERLDVTDNKDLAIYINRDWALEAWNTQGMSIINDTSKGISAYSIRAHGASKEAKEGLNTKFGEQVSNYYDEEWALESTENDLDMSKRPNEISATTRLDDKDNLKFSFNLEVPRMVKHTQMGKESKVDNVLGHSASRYLDVVSSKENNKKLVDIAYEDFKNLRRNPDYNETNYVEVTPTSKIKMIREAYEVMPQYMKDYIEKKFKGRPMIIRRDLMVMYFGNRAPSIANMKVLEEHPRTRRLIKLAGHITEGVVKLSTSSVLIKTPAVIIRNLLGNFATITGLKGIRPDKAIKYLWEGWTEARNFINLTEELAELKVKHKIGDPKVSGRINQIESWLKDSPVGNLMGQGFYQAIVEGEDVNDASGLVEHSLDKARNALPNWVRVGADWTFITSRTPLYKALYRFNSLADFISRYAVYKDFQEKKRTPRVVEKIKASGMTPKEYEEAFIGNLLDLFTNFDKAPGVALQWFERLGAIKFSKFLINTQRSIKQTVRENPLYAMNMLLSQYVAGVDTDSIMSQQLLLTDTDLSDKITGPMSYIENVAMPSSYEVLFK